MTVRNLPGQLLGLLLALIPVPGLCLDAPLPLHTAVAERPKLGLNHDYLQLAAADDLTLTTPAPPSVTSYDPEFPNLFIPAEPDWEGIKQDTKLFLLYQLGVVGALYLMPESISKWSTEDKTGNVFDKWNDNVNNLRKDKDEWGINYIGHPYFGSVYYVRARHRGLDRQDSFWYAAIMSTIYEYGIEALFEPVSIQDLIFTPVGGAVIGEYFMIGREKMKRNIAAKGYSDTSDKVLLFFTDPLGAINKKVNQWFGNTESDQARLDLFPLVSLDQNNGHNVELMGVQAMYRW